MLEEDRQPEMKILAWGDEREAGAMEWELFQQGKFSGKLLNVASPRRRGIKGQDVDVSSIEAVVTNAGANGAHVSLPKAWQGKKVKVTLVE